MRSKFIALCLFLIPAVLLVAASPNPAYVCSFCVVGLGLVEEAALQAKLEPYLLTKCNGDKLCEIAAVHFISSLEKKIAPDALCKSMNVCPDQCTLYTEWPVSLPPQPIPWPVERKLSENDYSILKPIFTELASIMPSTKSDENKIPMIAHIAYAIGHMMNEIKVLNVDQDTYGPCGFNITCKIEAISNHLPIQDYDGDKFSIAKAKKLRGTDWKGADCDDVKDDVYPGRDVTTYSSEVDHNCNGIYGANRTGSYEDLFCKDTGSRGLVMLGDSATAHFHIPPQWLTAQGWNLNGFLEIAEDELDFPMCSWGTGHVDLETCPYQYPLDGVNGVISLYTQLRDRNLCNTNDYQNVGVNGARMTSSQQLIDAFARHQTSDKPVLLWLSLIGNDVCNGHEGFDHMTTPDEFYADTMKSLNAIDEIIPPNSYVVSLALFEGELLYDTMHNKQHPVGAKYSDFYDYMNCLGENPCWGWLNSNATVRRMTTDRANELNHVYVNISQSATFKNFKYIYYRPLWVNMFDDYVKAGNPATNLIEPTDGFHPSQAGNALFAKTFFEWLETNHPDAIGPINPHNDEIRSKFFNV